MLATRLVHDPSLALATDQYELTMALGYWDAGMAEREAEFHMFFRTPPFGSGYVVLAGLAPLAEALQAWRFSSGDLDYLGTLRDRAGEPLFPPGFLAYLADLRFRCDVDAVPEGTVVFPNEPLVRVRGPLLQAQVLETLVLNTLNFQSLVATKAARVCQAAGGDPVVDFGLRRAQGLDGGLSASRAAYLGGCAGTSNVLAGKLLGIPVLGTHAHSWVMAFDSEQEAFRAFARAMPNNCVFLVDTYGTLEGIRNAIAVGHELQAQGHAMVGIRLDSGDLAALSRQARAMLDAAGLTEAVIMGSSDLDEHAIADLKARGAVVGAWGVGTRLVTAFEEPALNGVYKLAALRDAEGGPWRHKLKLSEELVKVSVPGLLQVYRCRDARGRFVGDLVAQEEEDPAAVENMVDPNDPSHQFVLDDSGAREPLLRPVFRGGRAVGDLPGLDDVRARVRAQLAALDEGYRRFEAPREYPIGLSPRLSAHREALIREARAQEGAGG